MDAVKEAQKYAGGGSPEERQRNAEAIAKAQRDFANYQEARLGTSTGNVERFATAQAVVTDADGKRTEVTVPQATALYEGPTSVPEGFDPEANEREARDAEKAAEDARINAEVERRIAERGE